MSEPGQLSMADVRRLTGLTERQIRYYDAKGLVVPERTQGGHRAYRHGDINRLLMVKELLTGGLSVAEVRERLEQAGHAGHAGEEPDTRHPFDERGLEDVKIYFGSLRRPRHDAR